ncbi:MAG: YitT family protein [Treponemataceae bacterium]
MRKKVDASPAYKRPGYERRRKIKNFVLLNLGTLLVSFGIHFFKYPNHFALGGISGVSVVLAALFPILTPAKVAFVINVLLIVLGLLLLGKNFAGKTIYASLLMSVLLIVFEKLFPMSSPFTDEKFMELILAIIFSGGGGAILFNINASSGGTDIIAMIIHKFTKANIGNALLASDALVVLATFFVFDTTTGILSSIGLIFKSTIVDHLLERFNRVKVFTIITYKQDEVGEFVTKHLQRTCTRIPAIGQYTGKDLSVFIVAVDLNQANILEKTVKEIDPSAFLLVDASSQIIGRGFTSF